MDWFKISHKRITSAIVSFDSLENLVDWYFSKSRKIKNNTQDDNVESDNTGISFPSPPPPLLHSSSLSTILETTLERRNDEEQLMNNIIQHERKFSNNKPYQNYLAMRVEGVTRTTCSGVGLPVYRSDNEDYYSYDKIKKVKFCLPIENLSEIIVEGKKLSKEPFDVSKLPIEFYHSIDRKVVEFEFSKTVNSFMMQFLNVYAPMIFEFLDSRTLIETCSRVSPEWNSIVFEKSDKLFRERVLNFVDPFEMIEDESVCEEEICTSNNYRRYGDDDDDDMDRARHWMRPETFNLENLSEIYEMNWMETFLMSGLYHLEKYGEEIKKLISKKTSNRFFITFLNLDPIPLLKQFLPENHPLIVRLSQFQPKLILLDDRATLYELNTIASGALITHSSVNFEDIVCTPCVKILPSSNLSVDMKQGIPLFMEFLRNISAKLLESDPEKWNWKDLSRRFEKFFDKLVVGNEFIDDELLLVVMDKILYITEDESIVFCNSFWTNFNMTRALKVRKEMSIEKSLNSQDKLSVVELEDCQNYDMYSMNSLFQLIHDLSSIEIPNEERYEEWIEEKIDSYWNKSVNSEDDLTIKLFEVFHRLHPNNYSQDLLRCGTFRPITDI